MLCIEYLGTNYHGWQKQPNVPSVQEELELALGKIANQEINLICAGRTDAGVHATNQYASFVTNADRNPRAWTIGANTYLPADIKVKWAKVLTDLTFHARYSAKSRSYRYIIFNSDVHSAIFNNHSCFVSYKLNAQAMHDGAQVLLGTHDFTSFRGPDCQSLSPIRTITKINVQAMAEYIYIDITGNAFLHNMVRNIVGALLEIGKNKRDKTWLSNVLLARDRSKASITAPAHGLYLTDVEYKVI
jgi:tRNA pseudouridine38-40 synthase